MNQTMTTPNSSQRNYGIDLLRLVAAFYVIILHTINQGGIYEACAPYSYQEQLCRILLIIPYCAVNIFGIISGYVGYREPLRKFSVSGYIPLWLTVVFYCLLSVGFYWVTLPGTVTAQDLARSFFPVTCNLFWYFSAYTLVYFLAPYLNKLLYHSSEKELNLLFFLICCILVPIEYLNQSFDMTGGYSAIWLLLLYLVGGIMKKNGIGRKIPSYAVIIAIILINFIFFYCGLKYTDYPFFLFEISFSIQRSYITPFYVASAILYVILFSRFRFVSFWQKLIKFAAPAAFSVYIANTTPLFWNHFLKDRFVSWADSSPAGIFVYTMLFSSAFVLAVVILDFFRQKLFRLMGVQNWASKLSGFLQKDKAA